MSLPMIRPAGMLITGVLGLFLVQATQVTAQVDVAGDWALEVTQQDGTVTMPTLTLEQDGTALTGRYSSATLGDQNVTGSVDGSEVTVLFSADPGVGMEIEVVYVGTVDEDGVWSGTLDLGGFISADFTGTRSDP